MDLERHRLELIRLLRLLLESVSLSVACQVRNRLNGMEVERGGSRRGKGRRVELRGGERSDRVVSLEWPTLLQSRHTRRIGWLVNGCGDIKERVRTWRFVREGGFGPPWGG